MSFKFKSKLRRTKSAGALDTLNTYCIDSNDVKCFLGPRVSGESTNQNVLLDSLNEFRRQNLILKIENHKLTRLMQQMHCLLYVIKDETNISYRDNIIAHFLEKSTITMGNNSEDINYVKENPHKLAKSLLAAIEQKHSPDGDTAEDLKKIKFPKNRKKNKEDRDNLSPENKKCQPSLLLKALDREPSLAVALERSNQVKEWVMNERQVIGSQDAEESVDLSNYLEAKDDAAKKISLSTQNAVLKTSRKKLLKISMPMMQVEPNSQVELLTADSFYAAETKVPPSPPQPVDPKISLIDHLMHTALIRKKISEKDFDGSFKEALTHCDLALVMDACRAADPGEVFGRGALSQCVMLSLAQQLATDMVYETQLKCRYLEEVLINLDVSDEVTRTHLPLVVGEIRKHLSKFVCAYPHHVAVRRISLIVMAADNLVKY